MSRRPPRPFRAAVESLEGRLAPAAGIDPVEVYTWQLINQMRANPARFADEVQALHDGVPGTYQGFAASDPVWAEIRGEIDHNPAQNGWSLAATLGFLRAQPTLPGLLLQDDLTARAADHTLWMEQHGYAHTGTTTLGEALPGFVAVPSATLESFNHDPARYAMPIGENINFAFSTDWAFEAAYKAGTIGRDGYVQRLAYYSAMSYILDIGLPDLGHLRNLLGRPDGIAAGTTGGLAVGHFDSIGIDEALSSYLADADVPNEYISTMRFDNVRDHGPKPGQYAGLSFTDANHNGLFDIGEAYGLTASPETKIVPGPVEPAPRVAGLRPVRGRQKTLTAVVVSFDEAVDVASAINLGAYTLTAAGAGKKARPKPVRLARATYDPTTHSVTLTLAKAFKGPGRLTLAVAAGVASSPSLVPLASAFSGTVPK